ncbi:ATP-synt_Vo_Ao_c_NTPK_rpt2 domain containing protein [Candidatus Nanopelagicaceae bacterium]
MKKMVSCFECGFKYDRKKEAKCNRCGEEKIFNPVLHDENYDIAKDPSRSGKYLIISTLVLFAIFSIMIVKGWKSIAI